jgi:hypothetical protein
MEQEQKQKLKTYLSKMKMLGVSVKVEVKGEIVTLKKLEFPDEFDSDKAKEIAHKLFELSNNKLAISDDKLFNYVKNMDLYPTENLDYSIQPDSVILSVLYGYEAGEVAENLGDIDEERVAQIDKAVKSAIKNELSKFDIDEDEGTQFVDDFVIPVKQWVEYKANRFCQNKCQKDCYFEKYDDIWEWEYILSKYESIQDDINYLLSKGNFVPTYKKKLIKSIQKAILALSKTIGNMYDIFTDEIKETRYNGQSAVHPVCSDKVKKSISLAEDAMIELSDLVSD